MRKMNHAKIASGLFPLLLTFGCATTQSISDAERSAIRSVSVAKKVAAPEQPVVLGPSVQKGFLLLGPIGWSIAAQGNSDSVAFKKFLDQHNINIAEIMRQEFISHLSETRGFPAVVADGGDAQFNLIIEDYGLAPGFSMRPIDKPLRPTLRLAAKLSSIDGKILWQSTEYITGMGDIESRPFNEYLVDPTLTRQVLTQAAQITARELLKDLIRSPTGLHPSSNTDSAVVTPATNTSATQRRAYW